MIKKIQNELFKCIPNIWRGLFLVWSAARCWTIVWGVLLFIQGVIPAGLVYFTKVAVDILATTQSRVDASTLLSSALQSLIVIAFLWIASQIVASLIRWVRVAQAELVQDSIHQLIHKKALELDVAFYENSESYDLLHRAKIDALSQPIALLESIGVIVQNSVTLIVLACLIAQYAWWLPLLLVGSALPGLWTVGRYVLREHKWRIANTINERRSRYFDWILTDRNSAAEMRLFHLGEHHRNLFHKLREGLRKGRLALVRDEMKSELFAGSITWIGGIAGIAWLLLKIAKGMAKLGDLVLCYQAFLQGQKLLRSMLESAGKIYRCTLFIDNLFEFLSQKHSLPISSQPCQFPSPILKGVCFEKVTFAYPDSRHTALTDFSLNIPAGRVVAIVGHNGAGKSTLIKLLCRFYDPDSGRILIDDVDIRSFDLTELRSAITVLFQEPVRYHTTAAENIAMGDLTAIDDDKRLHNAALSAGAAEPIKRLSKGYETVLGKWFGGAELSVGEWQRIALARAFLRNAAVIALDEPTSAMDSWAESDWLNRFRELTDGHTAVMITHRFTTAMHADIIHVMENGQITESGTHEELILQGGHYAESWSIQMQEMQHA